jgi:putative transposase
LRRVHLPAANFLGYRLLNIMLVVWIIFYCIYTAVFMLYPTQKYKVWKNSFSSIEPTLAEQSVITLRFRKKPEWVIREVIRLTAFMPNNGCRKIADVFNRLHSHKRAMTVSKSTVYNIIIRHKYEIYMLRKQIKQRKPKSLPKNIIWSMDLTTVTDDKKQQHITFGVVDNGTRACLLLKNIADKSSITLLRNLLNIIDAYGKPTKIRMDNEAVFKSRLFRAGLWILSIKPQFTQVACPWMNGRVERFFGTLKQNVCKIMITETLLDQRLTEFRYWGVKCNATNVVKRCMYPCGMIF